MFAALWESCWILWKISQHQLVQFPTTYDKRYFSYDIAYSHLYALGLITPSTSYSDVTCMIRIIRCPHEQNFNELSPNLVLKLLARWRIQKWLCANLCPYLHVRHSWMLTCLCVAHSKASHEPYLTTLVLSFYSIKYKGSNWSLEPLRRSTSTIYIYLTNGCLLYWVLVCSYRTL